MIDTREELIGALHQAAEIEHGLMIQRVVAKTDQGEGEGVGYARGTVSIDTAPPGRTVSGRVARITDRRP